jgi:hypothetical protein
VIKQTNGIIIGGILPALIYGIGGALQKLCNLLGIGLGYYVISGSIGSLIIGIVLLIFYPDKTISARSVFMTMILGMCSATAMALVGIGLTKYKLTISMLCPLYNMNTIVAVLLGLFIFAEWKEVHALRLFLGATLITIGGILVANS